MTLPEERGALPDPGRMLPEELAPRGPATPKTIAYKWGVHDAPGTFTNVPKVLLNVDAEYQRLHVSNDRVLKIARYWSWIACGTLAVARRPDGSLWVMDGQHRLLAARKRQEIQELPCLVFGVADRADEAKGFLNTNTVRGPCSIFDRFNAMLLAGDETALAVRDMVAGTGYTVAVAHQDRTVACIGCLLAEYRNDPAVAKRVWSLCCEIYRPRPPLDKVFRALCYLDKHLRRHGVSLDHERNRSVLVKAGPDKLRQKADACAALRGIGGPKVWAEGLLLLLNFHRRGGNRIPSISFEAADPGAGTDAALNGQAEGG
jgi:hypothetical protein